MFEDDYEDYIPVTISSTSPVSPSKPRMPRISRRRFSLSLAESFNQLEIPFKPKRKSSVPATPSSVAVTPNTCEMDNAKLNYFARREVGANYSEFIQLTKFEPSQIQSGKVRIRTQNFNYNFILPEPDIPQLPRVRDGLEQ